MRIKRDFGKRSDLPREINCLVFLVFEGERTEVIYFNGINDHKEKLGIKKNLKLVHVFRSVQERGWANPQKIVDQLLIDLKNTLNNGITFTVYINRLIDYLALELNGLIKLEDLMPILIEELKLKFHFTDDTIIKNIEKVNKRVSRVLYRELAIDLLPEKILTYFKESEITYDKERDRICLIVDRDYHSFIERQYDHVYKLCEENDIEFYLTNPCFEFWLLLHFKEALDVDRKQLLVNRKNQKKTFAENELVKLYPEFRKGKYDFSIFLPGIPLAIEQVKLYCENIKQLKYQVGSNLGILLTSLRE